MSNRGDGCWWIQAVHWVTYSKDVSRNRPRGLALKNHSKNSPTLWQPGQPRTMFCMPVQTLQLSRQCRLFIMPIKLQTYLLVLACSSWMHRVEKCSCKHVHAGRYPGIPLYNTNYSYQANEDTRPYDARVDEQMVMECTEQNSVEGVWTYKWTSKQQHAAILDILNLKKQCLESSDHTHKLHTQLTHLHLNDTKQF